MSSRNSFFISFIIIIEYDKSKSCFFLVYSTALERFYYPGINELPSGCPARPKEQFHVEPLQQLLYHYFHNSNPPCKFVEKLIWELESFVIDVRKQFAFQETEVYCLFCLLMFL